MTAIWKKVFVVVLLMAFTLTGCQTLQTSMEESPKTWIGGLGGAAAGGLLAAGVGGSGAAIAAGTILGGLIGGAIGNRMDAKDREEARLAAMQALERYPSGRTATWTNPDSGHSGTFTPTHTYQTASGQYCREYQQTVTIGGEKHQAYGTACRQPDGSWNIRE